jgi:Flp pilus assembly protein protease CpaA
MISTGGKTNPAFGTIIFISLILLAMVVDLGGGDIKLITALALFAEIHHPITELATLSTVLMTFQILVIWIKNGMVSARIALAPSICIPMIYSMVLH